MQSYAGKLVHTLVITDACESGATFLMAMRGGDDDKRCDNFELTKAKSSQVFTVLPDMSSLRIIRSSQKHL